MLKRLKRPALENKFEASKGNKNDQNEGGTPC